MEGFRSRIEEVLDDALAAMQDEIPSYRSADPAMVESVREHVRLHFEALLASLSQNRSITREDLVFVRPAATFRARTGVPLADFMYAFRIGQREIWALAAGIEDDETRDGALSVVEEVIQYVNLASTHAAEVYAEVEGLLQAQGERVERDLLEISRWATTGARATSRCGSRGRPCAGCKLPGDCGSRAGAACRRARAALGGERDLPRLRGCGTPAYGGPR